MIIGWKPKKRKNGNDVSNEKAASKKDSSELAITAKIAPLYPFFVSGSIIVTLAKNIQLKLSVGNNAPKYKSTAQKALTRLDSATIFESFIKN